MNSKQSDTYITEFCKIIVNGDKPSYQQQTFFKEKTNLKLYTMLLNIYGSFFSETDREIIVNESILEFIESILNGKCEIRNEGETINYIKKIASRKAFKVYEKRVRLKKRDPMETEFKNLKDWIISDKQIEEVKNFQQETFYHKKKYNKHAEDKDIFMHALEECMHRLSHPRYDLYSIMTKFKNDINQKIIAESMHISEPTVSRLINKKGLPSIINCLLGKGWDEVTSYETWRDTL